MIRKLRFFGWIAALALVAGNAFPQADQLPVSRTTGVLDIAIPAGQSTLMALPLAEIVASGTITSVSGSGPAVLDITGATLGDLTTTPHAIKITSRVDQRGTGSNAPAGSSTNAYGYSAQISANTASQVTADLAEVPNVGDEFVVYQLETLGSIFGATNTFGLTGGTSSAAADLVYLDSAGSLVAYFYKTGGLGGTGWKLVSDATGPSQEDQVVAPGAGLLIVRQAGSPLAMTATGDALPGLARMTPVAGFNLVNNPFTVPTTLAASGLEDWVTGGTSAAGADLIYLEDGGVITAYYYKTGGLGGTGWRSVAGGPSTDEGATVLVPGKALVFQEQTGSVAFALPEPFAD